MTALKHKEKLLLVLLAGLLLLGVFFRVDFPGSSGEEMSPREQEQSREEAAGEEKNIEERTWKEAKEAKEAKEEKEIKEEIVVDVSGAVKDSGIVKLPRGSRVYHALEEAEPAEEALLESINKARELRDGEKIIVPSEDNKKEAAIDYGNTSPGGEAGSSSGTSRVNINEAGPAELQELKNIGEVRSREIIDYREEHGRFNEKEEIKEVSGIGLATFEDIREGITIY